MTDKICIKNLEFFAKHGVFPEENSLGQKFIISVELFTDLRRAGRGDFLEKSVDYSKVCHVIKRYIEDNTYRLIETVAEGLAEKLLIEMRSIQTVKVEVVKPWAPVRMHLDAVSVEIERSRHRALVALGSNLGNRESYLQFAVGELGKVKGCRVLSVSNLVNTAPFGVENQEDYLNGCLDMETLLTPHELLEALKDIEDSTGRVREGKWGPRTLDLDIIFYDDVVISDGILTIPHAEAHKRAFVLEPLSKLAPYYVHPVLKKTVLELLEGLPKSD